MKKLNLMTAVYLTLAGCAGINGNVKNDADGELITIEKLEDGSDKEAVVPMLRRHFDIIKKYTGSNTPYDPESYQEEYALIYNADTNDCIWTYQLSCERFCGIEGIQRVEEAILDEGCNLTVDAIAKVLYIGINHDKRKGPVLLSYSVPIEWQPKKVLDERLRPEIPNVEALDADLGVLAENFGMKYVIGDAKRNMKRQREQQQKREGKVKQKAWNKKHK